MKHYAILLTILETETDKKWEDLTDEDFLDMDRQAFQDLKHMISLNDDPNDYAFRHYKTLEKLQEDIDW